MILPIVPYGQAVLREQAHPVKANTPELQRLIDDMIETMHGAEGIGLAGPQVGVSKRIFVVDVSPLSDDVAEEYGGTLPEWATHPLVFINPELQEIEGVPECDYEEGCLSIPDIRELVWRPEEIKVHFLDRNFQARQMTAKGILARVVQHEHDHLDGVLFLDYLSGLKRRLLKRRLREIAQGKVEAKYPMTTPG